MKNVGIVRGSEAQAKELIVSKTTVYVHTDIREVETEDGGTEYEYNEVQYDKDEYIQLMADDQAQLRADTDYLLMLNE